MALELRIALLVIGLVVLAALYFIGRSKRVAYRQEDEEFNFERNDLPDALEIDTNPAEEESIAKMSEELSDISDLVREDLVELPNRNYSEFQSQPSLLDEEEDDVAKHEEKLIVLHVMSRQPKKFSGGDIVKLTQDLNLEFDDMHVFHKKVERFSGKKALYTIVNMVKPGTFELNSMDVFETPGLSFVMNLPGPEEGLKAFNIMLEAAKKFADHLNGVLLDESRSRLSPQTIAHLQEEVQLFSLKNSRRA